MEKDKVKDKKTEPNSIDDIDLSELMDLRIDYAFKLFFGTEETHRLISLINAIFENKGIPRVVTDLTIVNPFLEKTSEKDKLSILDIRATLADGTALCIEIHLYDLTDLKYKTLRSWARIYGEDLAQGKDYTVQNTVICISFLNGAISDAKENPIEKIHSLFQVMERDGHQVLVSGMELHYINMKAFVKHCNRMDNIESDYDMFTKWMMFITQKEIKNKEMIRNICSEEEIKNAMEALDRLSKDKIKRQTYQRRMDEIYFYNKAMAEKNAALADKNAVIAEQGAALAEKDAALADKDAEIAEQGAALAEQGAVIAEQGAALADKDAALADKDAALADKDAALAEQAAEIAALRAKLNT